MHDVAVTNEVLHAYQRRWGQEVKADVVLIEPASGGGKWVSVESVYPSGKQLGEVCYIDPRGNVRVFETTPDLVRFLAGGHSWERRFLSPAVVGAIGFMLTLIAVIVLSFLDADKREDGFDALKGLLALGAGFYFGNTANRS